MNNILSPLTVHTGNVFADYNINALILAGIIILIPILIALIIPLFDSKVSKQGMLYLYAFTTGFFVVLGLFGEVNEGRELATEAAAGDTWLSIGYQILVLGVGTILAVGFALGFKIFINRKLGKYNLSLPVEQHSDHVAFHNHPHAHELFFRKNNNQTKTNKDKVVALYLILSHRIAAGFFLGYTVFNIVQGSYETPAVANLNLEPINEHVHSHDSISLAFFIGFFLHLIPEEIIIYYRQREMGITRYKAMLNSVLVILILVPFIFLGANIGQYVESLWWMNGILHVIVGVLFTFTALVEFFPEVIRETINQKLWYVTILSLCVGIITCFIVIAFGH